MSGWYAALIFFGGALLFGLVERYGLEVRERMAKVVRKYESRSSGGEPIYEITARDAGGIEITYRVKPERFQRTAIGDDFKIAYKVTRIWWETIPVKPSRDLPVII